MCWLSRPVAGLLLFRDLSHAVALQTICKDVQISNVINTCIEKKNGPTMRSSEICCPYRDIVREQSPY